MCYWKHLKCFRSKNVHMSNIFSLFPLTFTWLHHSIFVSCIPFTWAFCVATATKKILAHFINLSSQPEVRGKNVYETCKQAFTRQFFCHFIMRPSGRKHFCTYKWSFYISTYPSHSFFLLTDAEQKAPKERQFNRLAESLNFIIK